MSEHTCTRGLDLSENVSGVPPPLACTCTGINHHQPNIIGKHQAPMESDHFLEAWC